MFLSVFLTFNSNCCFYLLFEQNILRNLKPFIWCALATHAAHRRFFDVIWPSRLQSTKHTCLDLQPEHIQYYIIYYIYQIENRLFQWHTPFCFIYLKHVDMHPICTLFIYMWTGRMRSGKRGRTSTALGPRCWKVHITDRRLFIYIIYIWDDSNRGLAKQQ